MLIFVQEMKGIVIFYCALLSVIGMGEAALCISTEDCSDDTTLCVVNCSDVAVTMFNQPASHGNCRISITAEGDRVHACYIHECDNSHPGLCVPDTALGNDAVSCCCTEDECNDGFDFPDENSTTTSDIDCVLCVHVYVNPFPGPTVPPSNETHLYHTFPTHVGPGNVQCLCVCICMCVHAYIMF